MLELENLSMARKGMLLVALPLVTGTVLTVFLLLALEQAERETEREASAKAISMQVNQVGQMLFDSASSMSTYAFTKNVAYRKRYGEIVTDAPNAYLTLRQMVADRPEQLKLVNRMYRLQNRTFKLFEQLDNPRDSSSTIEFLRIMGLREHAQSIAHQFVEDLEKFRTIQSKYDRSSPAKAYSKYVKQLCLFGPLVAIALTAWLVAIFSRSVTRRLGVMIDNAQRMTSGLNLAPPVCGSDEITTLDVVFHSMARQVRANEARVRSIIESMPVALLITDEHGIIESSNGTADRLLGYQTGELNGVEIGSIVVGGNATIAGSFGRQEEQQWRRKGGEVLYADVSSVQIEMDDAPKRLVSAVDTTQKHAVEQAKREFFSMISHDLRAPLTSIGFSMEQLRSGNCGLLNENGRTVVARTSDDAANVVTLLDGLLDLEKIGQLKPRHEVVELNQVVIRAVNAVRHPATAKRIEIKSPAEYLECFADGAQLVQVLTNLLINAIKFSPEESLIEVAYQEVDDGECIEISVQDQGRGIPHENLSSVFERFVQVADADRDLGGKGLGLSICKSIVEAHGGVIGVESAEGCGARFWLRIPQPRS